MKVTGFFKSVLDMVRTSVLTISVVLIVLGNTLPAGPAVAGKYDDLPWTIGVGTVTLSDQGMSEAQEQALSQARDMAIESVAGVLVHSVTERIQHETDGKYVDQFRDITSLEVSGLIVEESKPQFRVEQAADNLFQVTCEIQAKVAIDSDQPNSSFVLRVDLKDCLQKTYRSGEQMVLEVQSTMDCYLTIFNVYTDGSVAVLLPNADMTSNWIEANHVVEVPSKEQRKKDISFELFALPDRPITVEYIFVIGTLKDYPFLSEEMTDFGAGYTTTFKADSVELSRWMLRIPRSERTRAETFYSIVP